MLRATIRSVIAHKLRLALTGLAIVLGVGFVAGTFVLTDTLNQFFTDAFSDANRGVDVQIQARRSSTSQSGADREEGVPADVVERVAAVDGVKLAIGEVGGYAQFVDRAGEPIGGQGPPTLGFSWADAPGMSPLTLRGGRPPRGPGEVMMDVVTARQNRFRIGDSVAMRFVGPQQRFTVVGLVGFGRADNLGGATLAVFDVDTAQKVLDSPGRFDFIAVAAAPGVAIEDLIERIDTAVPNRYEVLSGQAAADQSSADVKRQIGFIGTAVLFFAGIALFVGAFVIANTFAIVVAQRTRELALLRALGATGRQIMASVVGEAALVGLISSIVGLGFGVGVGVGLRRLIQAVSGGAALPGADILVLPRTIWVSLLLGLLVSVFSAIAPARRAARLSPVAAMREVTEEAGLPSARRSVLAAVVAAAGSGLVAIALFGQDVALRFGVLALGAVLVFVGLGLLAPLVTGPVASGIAWPLPRVAGVAGRLARANAVRNPGRTSATAAALMIGLTVVTGVSVLTASMKASITDVIADVLTADYFVASDQMQVRLSPEVGNQLRARPEVERAVSMRFDQWRYKGATKSLTAVSPDGIAQVAELRMKSGDAAALADGGVLVHEDVAAKLGLRVGSTLPMTFPQTGTVPIPVDGIFSDRRVLGSSYILAMSDYERGFTTRNDTAVLVKMRPGSTSAAADAMFASIARTFPNIKAQDQETFQKEQTAQFDQLLVLITALLGLAILIALLGIANTLALAIFERTRELGLLRAVGMSRRQVRRMVRLEAVLIAVFGAVLGVVLGGLLGWAAVRALADEGITHLVMPVGQLLVLIALAGLAGMGAAAFPARRAGRLDILAAIATD